MSVGIIRKRRVHTACGKHLIEITHRRILLAGKPREVQSLTAVQALESLRHLRSGECGPVVDDHDPDMSYYMQTQKSVDGARTSQERIFGSAREREARRSQLTVIKLM